MSDITHKAYKEFEYEVYVSQELDDVKSRLLNPIQNTLEESVFNTNPISNAVPVLREYFSQFTNLSEKLTALKFLEEWIDDKEEMSDIEVHVMNEKIAQMKNENEFVPLQDNDDACQEMLKERDSHRHSRTIYLLIKDFCMKEIRKCEYELHQKIPSTPEQASVHKITLAEGITAADIERIFTAMQQAGIITANVTGERIAQMFFAEKPQSLANSYDKAKSVRNGEAKGSKNSERLRKFADTILRDLKPK